MTNPSKQQPQRVPERYLRNALNNSTCPNVTYGMEKASLETATKTAERYLRKNPKKLVSSKQPRNVPCGALAKDSNTSRFRDQPFKTAATKTARTLPTESIKNNNSAPVRCLVSSKDLAAEMALRKRLRKTRTPAGFVTNPSKQQPQKVPERYLRNALNS